MKTLIVDDVEMNRELLAMFLEGRTSIISAESGEEALERVNEALAADAHFDLICMDISMPGISGHEALKRIREIEEAAGVPRTTVFMVTGSSSPDDMFDALMNGGCDDYLTKPLMQKSFNELLSKHGFC
ncbi:MAG: response regulator [Desulfuromonadaceae bacterium]|nr:response regulator [Desulfuromonadaceae bacterium]MDD2856240.1 response regulator [Desulfuromonadaceae bacterium]